MARKSTKKISLSNEYLIITAVFTSGCEVHVKYLANREETITTGIEGEQERVPTKWAR